MEGHTPGPWGQQAGTNGVKVIISGNEGKGAFVCTIHIPNGSSDPVQWQVDQRKANARLIAAAPELLAALQSLCKRHRAHLYPAEYDEARAAIAKATGATQ